MGKARKGVKLVAEEEYTISEELTAEARQLASKITGRKVTGELVINLNQGGVSTVRVRSRQTNRIAFEPYGSSLRAYGVADSIRC